MSISLDDLANGEVVDIQTQVLDFFEQHGSEAFTLQDVTNGIFNQNSPYGSEFDIESIRVWMPFSRDFIYGNLRRVYYSLSIVGTALSSLVESGKLESRSIKNPKPLKVEWYPPYVTYYFLSKP